MKKHHMGNWFRLDNAGKLYPSLVSARNTTLFRLSARLDKPVHAQILQQALEILAPRFPYYHVHLLRGAFWYYFTPQERLPKVEKDSRYPCMKMTIRQRSRFPFRVRAFKDRIAVEFSHIITDGTGAMIYFKALLAQYLKLKEGLLGPFPGIYSPDESMDAQEAEDAFQRYYQRGLPQPAKESKAFKIEDDLEKKGIYHVTTGTVSVKALKKLAKESDISITGYLTSLLIEVLQDHLFSLPKGIQRRRSAPIRICIPINLRSFFPSITMRNFFLSLNPWIDPRLGKHDLNEIISRVKHFMASHINEKILSQQISRNIRGERRLLVRLTPSWIKDLIIPGLYRRFGESAYSTVLSNLGSIHIPQEMMKHIKSLDFIPNPPEGTTRVKLGVISLGDEMTITFGRISKSSYVEREFFRKLVKKGIPVKVDSNIWKDNQDEPNPWVDIIQERS